MPQTPIQKTENFLARIQAILYVKYCQKPKHTNRGAVKAQFFN